MVLKAALLKESAEKAKTTATPNITELRLREANPANFLLRCFNALALDREVSAYKLQVPYFSFRRIMYYTYNENFVAVNLWWLRQYVGKAVAAQLPLSRHSSEPEPEMEEEHCLSNLNNSAPVNRFNDYRWRGEDLASLSFYE
jgi:hypothetical protein